MLVCNNCLNSGQVECLSCQDDALYQPKLTTRPILTQQVIKLITEQLDKQNAKGLAKYGVSVDHMTGYDYNVMAMQEMVDGLHYLMRENVDLKRENEKLKKTLQEIQS